MTLPQDPPYSGGHRGGQFVPARSGVPTETVNPYPGQAWGRAVSSNAPFGGGKHSGGGRGNSRAGVLEHLGTGTAWVELTGARASFTVG